MDQVANWNAAEHDYAGRDQKQSGLQGSRPERPERCGGNVERQEREHCRLDGHLDVQEHLTER